MTYGLSNGHMTDDVTWPQRCCEAIRSAILATAWLLVYISGDSTRQSVAATTTKVTTSGWILLGRQRPWSKGSSQQETHETYPIPTPKKQLNAEPNHFTR